jgi:hypothetical protein
MAEEEQRSPGKRIKLSLNDIEKIYLKPDQANLTHTHK